MKINLVGDTDIERIGLAFSILKERHGSLRGVKITMKFDEELVTIDENALTFFDSNSETGDKKRERHWYQSGFLSKLRCGLQR